MNEWINEEGKMSELISMPELPCLAFASPFSYPCRVFLFLVVGSDKQIKCGFAPVTCLFPPLHLYSHPFIPPPIPRASWTPHVEIPAYISPPTITVVYLAIALLFCLLFT